MPHLSWNEVRARAIRFSRNWSDATSERADKQTFYNEFFDVFGIRRASVAAFETNVRNLQGYTNAIDLLWRGKLIVEHKIRRSLAQNSKMMNNVRTWIPLRTMLKMAVCLITSQAGILKLRNISKARALWLVWHVSGASLANTAC